MGYRHYFYSIPKKEMEEIKQIKTIEEFCDWAESKGYDVERYDGEEPYCAIYNIGKDIYCFGKYVDWAFKMQEKNESIFGCKELEEKYEDYVPVICTKEDFLTAIEEYKKNIIKFYKGLLEKDEKRHRSHIENQLYEWENGYGFCAINTDLSKKHICDSWLYEYAIFELARLYKAFDWENDALMLLGW